MDQSKPDFSKLSQNIRNCLDGLQTGSLRRGSDLEIADISLHEFRKRRNARISEFVRNLKDHSK